MQYVVCYDIGDDRRRDRVATALLDYGRRVQESVFVANLDEVLVERMLRRLEGLVEPSVDCLHVFLLCGQCEGKTVKMGRAEVPVDKGHYIL